MEGIANQVQPFDFINRTDTVHFLNIIRLEHPQTIALILASLDPVKASFFLQNLPCDLKGEVAGRIATMGIIIPEILHRVERMLEKKLSTLSGNNYVTGGGIENIANILNNVDKDSKKQIIKVIANKNGELAEEIKYKIFTKTKFKWLKWFKYKITLRQSSKKLLYSDDIKGEK